MGKHFARLLSLSLVLLTLMFAGCGAGSSSAGILNPGGSSGGSVPASKTVFVVVLENKNYSDVVGSSSMPYLNGLFAQGSLATNYYADAHPSIPNYFMLTAGQIETLDDSFNGTVTDDNLVREAVAAGKSWKVYAESIPSVGYTGGDSYPYLRRHNPFSFFSDVQTGGQAANMVPLSQLSSDIASANLPNVAFIVPNAYDEGHDCLPNTNCTTQQELQQADNFLRSVLPGVINSSSFQGGSGLMAVVFDESENDFTNVGGRVAAFFIGPNVKAGYQATGTYQHENLLRTVCDSAGVAPMGRARGAAGISEIFK